MHNRSSESPKSTGPLESNTNLFRRRPFRKWLFRTLIALFAAACSHSRAQPLTFVLSADGLPQDGMWKSTPVFADINGDGFPDLIALCASG
jgi:hypothetical protein